MEECKAFCSKTAGCFAIEVYASGCRPYFDSQANCNAASGTHPQCAHGSESYDASSVPQDCLKQAGYELWRKPSGNGEKTSGIDNNKKPQPLPPVLRSPANQSLYALCIAGSPSRHSVPQVRLCPAAHQSPRVAVHVLVASGVAHGPQPTGPSAWIVTANTWCATSARGVDPLEDGTARGWAPPNADFELCRKKCAASANCNAFNLHTNSRTRHDGQVFRSPGCYWYSGITADASQRVASTFETDICYHNTGLCVRPRLTNVWWLRA